MISTVTGWRNKPDFANGAVGQLEHRVGVEPTISALQVRRITSFANGAVISLVPSLSVPIVLFDDSLGEDTDGTLKTKHRVGFEPTISALEVRRGRPDFANGAIFNSITAPCGIRTHGLRHGKAAQWTGLC